MDDKLSLAVDILRKNHQENLLDFYDEITDYQKEKLLKQIMSIDFSQLRKLFKLSKDDDSISVDRISPLNYISKNDLSKSDCLLYEYIGLDIIKNGELAVLTLAGGQGTRLGYKGPKGSYEIDIPPKKSLFEFICDQLKYFYSKYNVYLPWYIMTSPSNDSETKKFFEKKNFFNYPKQNVYFFKQSTLPIINTFGNLFLDNLFSVAEASNGNGDVFNAFYKANLFNSLYDRNIKWISISGVDNIILEIIDPLFIGLTICHNSVVSSKSVKKDNVNSSDWIFANVDGYPSIVDPSNLSYEQLNSKSTNGKYCYNQINILSHLFNINAFYSLKDINLPYHRAFKKSDFINEEGMKVVPKCPNVFKFEQFIFDSFKYFNNFTLFEVDAFKEFAPIKSFTGNETPETALELYLKKNKK